MHQRQAYKLHPFCFFNSRAKIPAQNAFRAVPFFIGISGNHRPDMNHFLEKLIHFFGDDYIGVLKQEYYFKKNQKCFNEHFNHSTVSDPEFLDTETLMFHLNELFFGRHVKVPKQKSSAPFCEDIIEPKPVICVVGKHLFFDPRVERKFNHSVYIENRTTGPTMVAPKSSAPYTDQFIRLPFDNLDNEIKSLCLRIVSENLCC